MSHISEFNAPDRVVIGTVGAPGERAFYLQVRQRTAVFSVLLEKQQAQALALYIRELLEEGSESAGDEVLAHDNRPLDMPLTEEFRVMALGVAQEANGVIVIDAASTDDDDDDDETSEEGQASQPKQQLRVRMSAGQAREFVRRTLAVVSAGRRSCPLCEQPMHPSGHICPRANGYHRLR